MTKAQPQFCEKRSESRTVRDRNSNKNKEHVVHNFFVKHSDKSICQYKLMSNGEKKKTTITQLGNVPVFLKGNKPLHESY